MDGSRAGLTLRGGTGNQEKSKAKDPGCGTHIRGTRQLTFSSSGGGVG